MAGWLAGSCGLEYTLELTKEGKEKRGGWGGGWSKPSYSYSSKSYSNPSYQWSELGGLILLAVIGIVIYAMYKTCVESPSIEWRVENGATASSGTRTASGFGGTKSR